MLLVLKSCSDEGIVFYKRAMKYATFIPLTDLEEKELIIQISQIISDGHKAHALKAILESISCQ